MQFLLLFTLFACTNAKSLHRRADTYEYEEPNKEVDGNRINATRAVEYLSQFGYIGPGKLLSEGSTAEQETPGSMMKRAISDFQEMAGLSKTGVLDEETMKEMEADRCGVPDVQDLTDGVIIFKGVEGVFIDCEKLKAYLALMVSSPGNPEPIYTMYPNFPVLDNKFQSLFKWKKTRITYSIESFTAKVPKEQIRQVVRDAYNAWSEVIPLDFAEAPIGTGDIKIHFGAKYHADCMIPFDGEGHTLAHALKADKAYLHFDDDEKWTYKDVNKLKGDIYKDLYAVAIHEVGHTLAMLHLKNPKSVLYFKYQSTLDENGNYKLPVLSQYDIEYAQELYGVRKATNKPGSSETTVKPTTARPIPHNYLEKAIPQLCLNENKCCGTWAAGDQCVKNAEFMNSTCRASCGACIPQYDVGDLCEDCNPKCTEWANSGECDRNKQWMSENCRRACGLCHYPLSGGFWNARDGEHKYTKGFELLVRSGRMAVLHGTGERRRRIDLFSMGNAENPTLLGSCELSVSGLRYGGELIPGTTLVVHVPWENYSTLAIYDVATCRNVFERDIGMIEVESIDTGSEEIVIKGKADTKAYSYKHGKLDFVAKLYESEKFKNLPAVSDNGMVAYKGDYGINIYSVRDKAVVTTINAESVQDRVSLTPNGAFLVAQSAIHISVYEVASGKKIASTPKPERKHFFEGVSDDARCLALIDSVTEIVTVTCFDLRSGNNDNNVEFAYTFPNSNEATTGLQMFRKIEGVQHFQYITRKTGIMRLFRINERQKKWDHLT